MEKYKTHIRQSENGHQVGFTIGNQTFYLQEVEGEKGFSSKEKAAWYETQLRVALDNLK